MKQHLDITCDKSDGAEVKQGKLQRRPGSLQFGTIHFCHLRFPQYQVLKVIPLHLNVTMGLKKVEN